MTASVCPDHPPPWSQRAFHPAATRPANDSLIRLRRDGSRPLRFAGKLIARHDASANASLLWHDLGLYLVADGGYAIEIVARRIDAAGRMVAARCHANLAITLDDALSRFEQHDAARDICPGLSAPNVCLDDPGLSPTAMLIQATALHGLRQDVVRRYKISVGLFLLSLGRHTL